MLVFHAMLSVADQVTGRPTSLETPWPFGPRNRVQFSALAELLNDTNSAKQVTD
jgi:hypothetical protein